MRLKWGMTVRGILLSILVGMLMGAVLSVPLMAAGEKQVRALDDSHGETMRGMWQKIKNVGTGVLCGLGSFMPGNPLCQGVLWIYPVLP